MLRLLFVFLSLFSFSKFVFAGSGCAIGTSGAISEVIICAVDNGKSNVELAVSGLISIAAVITGVYLVTSLMNK